MGRRIFNVLAAISLAFFFALALYCIGQFASPLERQASWHLGNGYIIRLDAITIYLSQRVAGTSALNDIISITFTQLAICSLILPGIWAIYAITKTQDREKQFQKSCGSRPRSKCDLCGCESPLTAAFVSEQVSFRRARTRCLCPGCFKRHHVRKSATAAAFVLLTCAAVCVFGIYIRNYERAGTPNNAMNFALAVVFVYLLIIPHELGHAIAARLLRWDIFRVTFGIGPCWMEWRVGGIPVQFRLIPDRGSVSTLSLRHRDWRACRFITIAAGPLVNLAIAILAIELAGGWTIFISDPFASVWSTLGAASAFVFVVSLIPQTVWTQEGKSVTDGLQMARLLFKPLPSERVRRIAYFLAKGGALAAIDKAEEALKVFSAAHIEYPEDASVTASLATTLMMTGKAEEGRSLVCGLLQVHKTENAIRAVLRNNLAWADLLIGTPALLGEADEMSAAALSLMPWEAYVQGTRGTVLAIIGNPDEAMQLLRKAMKGADRRYSRSAIYCSMAIAEHRQGHPKAAEKLVERARRLYPKCDLLSRAEEELSGRSIVSAFASI